MAELQDLYVMPAHRRRGVAAGLIDDAVRWAKAANATLLEVVIAPNGRDVSHLFGYYAAHGFHDEDRRLLSLVLLDLRGRADRPPDRRRVASGAVD